MGFYSGGISVTLVVGITDEPTAQYLRDGTYIQNAALGLRNQLRMRM